MKKEIVIYSDYTISCDGIKCSSCYDVGTMCDSCPFRSIIGYIVEHNKPWIRTLLKNLPIK